MNTRMSQQLKAETLEQRAAPLSIATTEPVLDMPVDAQTTEQTTDLPETPCFSPKATSQRAPIVYQDLV